MTVLEALEETKRTVGAINVPVELKTQIADPLALVYGNLEAIKKAILTAISNDEAEKKEAAQHAGDTDVQGQDL